MSWTVGYGDGLFTGGGFPAPDEASPQEAAASCAHLVTLIEPNVAFVSGFASDGSWKAWTLSLTPGADPSAPASWVEQPARTIVAPEGTFPFLPLGNRPPKNRTRKQRPPS